MDNFIENNSKALYEMLLNQTNLGVLIVNKLGNIIDINQAALDIVGSPSKESTQQINLFIFKPLVDMGFPGDLFITFNKLVNTNGESYYTTKWGNEIYLKYKIYPVIINEEVFAKIVLEDLTEFKKKKDEFKKHERILIDTFNALEDLIIVIDKDYNIITSTWEDARVLNLLGEENKCYNTFFGSDSPCKECRFNSVLKEKKTITYEKNDGNGGFFEIKLIPIFDIYGAVEVIVEHYHDISEIKKNEIRLKKLKKAIETVSDIIVITDKNGIIEFLNPAFTRVTGYTYDEAIGQNPRVLKSKLHDKKFYKELWNTITMGKTWTGVFTNKKKDGTFYQELASISPIFNDEREIINFIAVKRDITKETQLQKQLMESQKLESVGILASGIAHEINTPLQYLMDNLTFIKENFEDLKEYKKSICDKLVITEEIEELQNNFNIDYIISEIPEALKDSLNGVNIIRNIIDSMRTFSHNSENKEIIENINKHIISTIKISKNYWKNILSIELNLSENLPKIKANIGKLNQVFLNLIINAVDAIKDDRNKHKKENKIIVSSYLKEDKLVISFKDTGVGIDEENRDKIFTLFFTTKEVGKGTGQGLSISYSIIVNEHLGKMYFESQKFKGSTFFIELPLLEE